MSQFDIVVFGASSFVGQILCRYLVNNDEGLNWAIAGRSNAKLDQLKLSLNSPKDIAIIHADAADEDQLKSLCESTKVVVSTVGPYALYGETLVKTCASLGTDYCDLTGEVQWIAKMIERYEGLAQRSGARIVNSCGFDSIPSDLGVYFLQQQAKQQFDEYCETVKMRVKKMKGAASGGTVASMINIFKEATTDAELRKTLANPYAICPTDHGFTAVQNDINLPQYDDDLSNWVAPFVMSIINTRIVYRTNAMLTEPYGSSFTYNEAMLTGKGILGSGMAMGIGAGLGGFAVAAAIPPSRWALEKFILPKPGEGPSEKAQVEGFYDLRFFGKTETGQTIRAKVTGDQDPGYGSTGKMLGQAALCLAKDLDKDEKSGGFWTPASIFKDKLINRLQENAGLTFELI